MIIPTKDAKGVTFAHSQTDPPIEFLVREAINGFEFFYHESWYSAKDGLITKMAFSPSEMGDKGEGPAVQSEN